MKRVVCVLIACIMAFSIIVVKSDARSKRIETVLDAIVEICAEHWEDRHGYASTCAMMAGNESTFGKFCSGYNLWGINSGRTHYGSLREGVEAWLNVINLHYYPGATDTDSGDEQLRILLDNGYCQPVGAYYANCMSLKRTFNLGELDKRMFDLIERKKEKARNTEIKERKDRQQGDFKIIFDDSLSAGTCISDSDYIKKGSTVIIGHNFYEVCGTQNGLENTLILAEPSMSCREFFLDDDFWGISEHRFKLQDVIENVVG